MAAVPGAAGRSDTTTPFDWNFLRLDSARAALPLTLFGLAYAALVFLGHGLREQSAQLVIIWPAAGLLFFALCVTPTRKWIVLIALQLSLEILIDYLRADHFNVGWTALYAGADSIDAIVGAAIARRFILAVVLPRIQQLVIFLGACGIGAGASALLGAFGATHMLTDPNYLHEWQLWWAGNWLGSLTVGPVAMNWAIRWRMPDASVRLLSRLELTFDGVLLLIVTVWIFSAPPASIATILQLPFVLLALLVVAAFRLPPRWATSFAAGVVLLAAWYSSHGLGPFVADPSAFARVGSLQIFLAALVIFTYMLSTVLLERTRIFDQLSLSEERYRQFVNHSSEAVWRVELRQPMAMGLVPAAQIEWLRQHAYIAECNVSYRHLQESETRPADDIGLWRADVPWSAIFLEHLETAAQQGFSLDGLRFELKHGDQHEVYLAAFSGVIEHGKLVRIWGVARNITQLADLNVRLQREQGRLQAYARQLVGAEERARRSAAVFLQDGIEQRLAGMKMTLEAVSRQAPAGLRQLHDELRESLFAVQNRTQQLISDLSPPGLYDLGLADALQWLAVYMRTHANLHVALKVNTREAAIDLELRVLVYQVIRELLRNVAKHAHVESAQVVVEQTKSELRVEVADHGRGFEWQYDLFLDQSRGFGLFSICDRVNSARGQFSVDTAPGKGCRVSISFPLGVVVEANEAQRAAG